MPYCQAKHPERSNVANKLPETKLRSYQAQKKKFGTTKRPKLPKIEKAKKVEIVPLPVKQAEEGWKLLEAETVRQRRRK